MENEKVDQSSIKELQSEYIKVDDLPAIIGQIATAVKGHFQTQIDGLTLIYNDLLDRVKGLEADVAKEACFTKELHKTLHNHVHKEAK